MNWNIIQSLAERNIVILDSGERIGVCRIGTVLTVNMERAGKEAKAHGLEIQKEGLDVIAVHRGITGGILYSGNAILSNQWENE